MENNNKTTWAGVATGAAVMLGVFFPQYTQQFTAVAVFCGILCAKLAADAK